MLLSIIIPTREEEKAIRKTIEQLRKVDVPHEIIVSDARSKDRTVEIARQFADVAVVFEGAKHTAGIGRNDGAKVAKGDFLAFVDADTYIIDPPAFFKRALLYFEDPDYREHCPMWKHGPIASPTASRIRTRGYRTHSAMPRHAANLCSSDVRASNKSAAFVKNSLPSRTATSSNDSQK